MPLVGPRVIFLKFTTARDDVPASSLKTRSLISGFGIIPTEVPLSPSSLLSPPRLPSGQLNDALGCPLHPAARKSGARYVIETWVIRSTHNMPSERHRRHTTITIRQTRWRRCRRPTEVNRRDKPRLRGRGVHVAG